MRYLDFTFVSLRHIEDRISVEALGWYTPRIDTVFILDIELLGFATDCTQTRCYLRTCHILETLALEMRLQIFEPEIIHTVFFIFE